MTVGQRIAQKRKELGLSQEALGERLGVSRQAIYKWESDAALPEIEKLVNLSREFSVPVGWLLGEEDGMETPRELTAEQLRMVEEIVGRYLAAQPAPASVPAKQQEDSAGAWPWFWGLMVKIAAAAALFYMLLLLYWRLGELEKRYWQMDSSSSSLSREVNEQITDITRRVEEILESQNALTAERSAQVAERDYRASAVTISARAVPKTYVEGMTAEFLLSSGGETVSVPGALGEDHAFTAQITGPLSDDITVSVVFLTGDQRETQVVERFTRLYELSLPVVIIHSGAWCRKGEDQSWTANDWVHLSVIGERDRGANAVSIRLGLFRDGKRIAWYKEENTEPPGQDRTLYFSLEEEIPLEAGVGYTLGALVTDEYGREWVVAGDTCTVEDHVPGGMTSERSTDPSELVF